MKAPKTLSLHLQSTSSLFIADAGAGKHHLDDQGYIKPGKVQGTLPVARTERKPILVPKEISGADSDSVILFPYIKANNMVGRLRRFAQDAINEVLIERGETISDKAYRGLSCGATSGTPTGIEPTLKEHRDARAHFYMGLFGGGSGMFSSGMSFGDFDVKHKYLISAGVLPAETRGAIDVNPHHLTHPVVINRRDRMNELSDFHIEQVLKGGEEAIHDWRSEAARAAQDKKEEKEGAKRLTLRNLVAYEAAPAGLSYQSKVVFNPFIEDAQVGLLLEALTRFARANAIGGRTAKGLGRFNLTVKEGDEVLLQSVDGEVIKSAGGKYTESLVNELDNLDVELLESFFA